MKKDKAQSILIIGPFPNPISGVSLANKVVKEALDASPFFETQIIDTSYSEFEEDLGVFSLKKTLFYLKINFKIYKIFRNNIIYITPGQTFFGVAKYSLFIILSSLLKKELIVHVHGNYLKTEYETLKGKKKQVFKFLISKFSKGIVLSNSLRKNLTPFLEEKMIYVLPNFAQSFLMSEKKAENNTLKIIYLSNLMKEKGIFALLDSLKEMENNGVRYEAKIAGNIDQKYLEEIQKKVSNLSHVTYLGIVKGEKKKELLNWGTVFVLPTYYSMEGQPISIIEAMATENVIITTNHAGIPDIIKDKINGFFVQKNNESDLTNQLTSLSENLQVVEKIAKENKKYFLENFTEEKFKERLIKIVTEHVPKFREI